MTAVDVLTAVGDVFPWPERNYMTTGGYILLGFGALAVKVILARINQATELARLAVEKQEKVELSSESAKQQATLAAELSKPTGNGFATAVLNALEHQRDSAAQRHLEIVRAMDDLAQRVERLEGRP